MLLPDTPRQNHLLAALPVEDYQRVFPHLKLVKMRLGSVLHESDMAMRYAYFPTSAIVSLFYFMEDGASAEVAMIGTEGIVGGSLCMGSETTLNRAVVQSPGFAFRLSGWLLKEEFQRSSQLQNLLLRYTLALLEQTAQSAVCNRHHSLEQQFCRLLLLSLDRMPGNVVMLTQELIANMLGVRREGVTAAAGNIQKAGLIKYRRGIITVLDREGLEARACECYAVVKKEYDRLLPEVDAKTTIPPGKVYALPHNPDYGALSRKLKAGYNRLIG
jgi:hypothetical protein